VCNPRENLILQSYVPPCNLGSRAIAFNGKCGSTILSMNKEEIRRDMADRLRELSLSEREKHSKKICSYAQKLIVSLKAKNVALYISTKSEVGIEKIIECRKARNINFYVPKVKNNKLIFIELTKKTKFKLNKYNIFEPLTTKQTPISKIDLFLTPLLAYDQKGRRLGKGGGYYDRTFKKAIFSPGYRRIRLVGIAFGIQKVKKVPTDLWDINLWALINEMGLTKH
jgi:5-formyltetrahydrofolate cyclo-ligase